MLKVTRAIGSDGTGSDMRGIVRNVSVFSNPSWIELMVAVTECSAVVAIAFNVPTGMNTFFFGNRSAVDNLSVIKLAAVSNNARHRTRWRLLSYMSIAGLVINSCIVVLDFNDICRSTIDVSSCLSSSLSVVGEHFGVLTDYVQRSSTPAGAASQCCIDVDADADVDAGADVDSWCNKVLCRLLHLRQFRNLHSFAL